MNIFYLKNCLCTTFKNCKRWKHYGNLTIQGVKGREKNDFNTRPSKRWIWKLCFFQKGKSRLPGAEGKNGSISSKTLDFGAKMGKHTIQAARSQGRKEQKMLSLKTWFCPTVKTPKFAQIELKKPKTIQGRRGPKRKKCNAHLCLPASASNPFRKLVKRIFSNRIYSNCFFVPGS